MNKPQRKSSPGRRSLSGFHRQRFSAGFPILSLLAACLALSGYLAWRVVSAAEMLNISTVAGSSLSSGLAADFQSAGKIAVSPDGTIIYVADTGNHVVRKINLSASTIEVIAGTQGQSGFSGDGQDGKQARLNRPSDVALDAVNGNLYIADTGNNRIRKLELNSNTITTLSGTGVTGGQDGAIASATFNQPEGVGVDSSGSVYVADTGNNRVRRITGNNVITLAGDPNNEPGFAGDGTAASNAQFAAPRDVAVDSLNSRIYIADSGNNRIRVILGLNAGDTINTFAGTGSPNPVNTAASGVAATTVDLNNPSGLAIFESTGNGSMVYISDTGNNRVRKVNTTNSQLETIAGSGTQGFDGDGTASGAGARALNVPIGIAVPQNTGSPIFVLDSGNRRLRKVNFSSNQLETVVSDGSSGFSGDGEAATSARLSGPRGVAVDEQGNFYIADTDNHVIRRVNKSDGVISTIAGQAGQSGFSGDGFPATQALLSNPADVAVDASGNIYISDTGNNKIRRINQGGIISTIEPAFTGLSSANPAGAKFLNPQGIALDASGNLYIANAGVNNIVRMGPNGNAIILAGSENASAGSLPNDGPLDAKTAIFRSPSGIDVDADGNVYVADTLNHKVRKIFFSNNSFLITTLVSRGLVKADFSGDGSEARFARLNSPTDVTVDASGNLYVADRGNNRIRKVTIDTKGTPDPADDTATIDTVINAPGTIGFSGDGGPGATAALGLPYRLVYSPDGLYIADTGNNRIRRATAPPNSNPALTVTCSGSACPNPVTIPEGQTVTISLQGTDPDAGQTLTWSFSETSNQALTGAAVNPTTGAASTFTWTPGFNVAPNQPDGERTHNVKFRVTDNGSPAKFAEVTVAIKVTNVNQAPTASITTPVASPIEVEATGPNGVNLPLAGTATDADGDTLTIQWNDNGNPIAGATTLTPTASLGLGQHSLTLTVSDGKGGTFTTSPAKVVNVTDKTPPQFTSIPADISVPLPQGQTSAVVNYTLPTATDTVSGVCTINGVPCSLTVTPADKVPGAVFPAGETVVTFNATDGSGNLATASFKVVVGTGGSGSPVNYRINSFAGSGNFGSSGSGGPAANASFKRPAGIAVDNSGNVYIADTLARIVRKVNAADGVITNYAGTGERGASGDGGPATLAKLSDPTGLAVDGQGNLYIADTGNHVIRRVNAANGLISTVAGSFSAGFAGDNGLANAAKLNFPTSVAVDGQGNLYIADTANHRIRKVGTSGLISTIAGAFIAGFSGDGGLATDATLDSPTGVAVTSDGSTIYIADQRNHRIRRIVGGVINTFAGSGTVGYGGDGTLAVLATLNTPTSVAIDPDSNLLITDTGNDRIRRVSFSDNIIATVAGTGAAGNNGDGGLAKNAQLDTPAFLGIDRRSGATRGEVYVSDTGNNRVRKLTISNASPVPTTVADQVVRKDRTLDIPLSAADADGDPVTFSVVSQTPLAFLSITSANPSARTATLRVAPGGGNTGVYNVQIKATDSHQASTLTPQFTITITDNRAPVACIAGGSQVTISSGPVTIVVDGRCSSDPDNDPVTYDWKEGATSLGSTSTIAPTLSPGTHDIMLTVSDGSLTSSFTQRIIVGGGNTLQAIINGPSSLNSPNGNPVQASFDGSSSTGSPNSFNWKVDGNTASQLAAFSVNLSVGTHLIELTVGNGQTTSTATKQVTVTTGGPTACIDGGATKTVTSTNNTNAQVTLTSTCTTGTGTLTYEWSEGATILGSTASINPTLTVGSHTIRLKVTDSQNRSSEATQTVTVDGGSSPATCGGGVGLYICSQGVEPSAGKQGQTIDVTISGNGFQQGATVSFSGDGITTAVQSVTSTKIVVRVTIANNAQVGSSNTNRRIITVKNPDASTVSTGRVFSVYPR
jgi:sugar lactone lactonase YvrE